jgi:hypothetical protein
MVSPSAIASISTTSWAAWFNRVLESSSPSAPLRAPYSGREAMRCWRMASRLRLISCWIERSRRTSLSGKMSPPSSSSIGLKVSGKNGKNGSM